MTKNDSPEQNTDTVDNLDAAELGAMLREARSAHQRTLSEIASELRIRLVYLEAIEEGRLDRLPGPAYESGFLRVYGDYLGLDGNDLVRKFKLAGVGGGRMDLHLPSPIEEGRLPTGRILLVAAVLAIGAYGGWYYLSSQGRDPLNFVASLPEYIATQSDQSDGNQAVLETAPPAELQEGDRSAAAKPSIDKITETIRRNEKTVDAPASPPAKAAEVKSPPKKAIISNTKTSKDNNAKKSVIVRATADSWVEIRSGDNDPILSKVMHAGEVYKVPPLPGLTLATGNAGAIEIVVDGRTLPSLGPMGGVRRKLALDANSLLSGAGQTH